MLVAKKHYYYDENNIDLEKQKKIINKKNVQRKNNNFLKVSAVISILIISSSLIFLLSRYTAISETKYRIHKLNKEILVLEKDLQDMKAELDKVTRSDIIEKKASEQLNMQYPQYSQMVFLNLESDLDLPNEENHIFDEHIEEVVDNNMLLNLKSSLKKLYSLLD